MSRVNNLVLNCDTAFFEKSYKNIPRQAATAALHLVIQFFVLKNFAFRHVLNAGFKNFTSVGLTV